MVLETVDFFPIVKHVALQQIYFFAIDPDSESMVSA